MTNIVRCVFEIGAGRGCQESGQLVTVENRPRAVGRRRTVGRNLTLVQDTEVTREGAERSPHCVWSRHPVGWVGKRVRPTLAGRTPVWSLQPGRSPPRFDVTAGLCKPPVSGRSVRLRVACLPLAFGRRPHGNHRWAISNETDGGPNGLTRRTFWSIVELLHSESFANHNP